MMKGKPGSQSRKKVDYLAITKRGDFVKQIKTSHEATRSFRGERSTSTIPVRLISLLACAALVGSVAYVRADDRDDDRDAREHEHHGRDGHKLGFAGPEGQNELSRAPNDITLEMHEGTNMAASPSPDGTKIALSLQGGLWILQARSGTASTTTACDSQATQPEGS